MFEKRRFGGRNNLKGEEMLDAGVCPCIQYPVRAVEVDME